MRIIHYPPDALQQPAGAVVAIIGAVWAELKI